MSILLVFVSMLPIGADQLKFCSRTCQFDRLDLIWVSILLVFVSIWPIWPDQAFKFASVRVNLGDLGRSILQFCWCRGCGSVGPPPPLPHPMGMGLMMLWVSRPPPPMGMGTHTMGVRGAGTL